jgi:hypothetical protein
MQSRLDFLMQDEIANLMQGVLFECGRMPATTPAESPQNDEIKIPFLAKERVERLVSPHSMH